MKATLPLLPRQHAVMQSSMPLHVLPLSQACLLIPPRFYARPAVVTRCTDAAIYMHLLGARLLPGPEALPMDAYAAACSPTATARLFLEAMHEEWMVPANHSGGSSNGTGTVLPTVGVHVFAPNFENAYESDKALHKRMHMVLCKVRAACLAWWGGAGLGVRGQVVVWVGWVSVRDCTCNLGDCTCRFADK